MLLLIPRISVVTHKSCPQRLCLYHTHSYAQQNRKNVPYKYFILASTPITRLINKHHQLQSSPAPCPFHVSVFGFNGGFFPYSGSGSFLPNIWNLWCLFLFSCVSSHPFFSYLFVFYFFFLFFLYCFITNIVTGDQSPSSPGSRWPGANYGNRTLGVCI